LSIPDSNKEQLRIAISKRYRNQFWVTFAIFSAIVLVIILAFFLLKDSRIWYASDPLYPILYMLKDLFYWIIAVVWFGGTALIAFMQWRRSASDIVGMVSSIEIMQRGKEGYVVPVPSNLTDLQPIMQEMFDSALKDRKAVEETEKRKSDLVLYLAHDLKTPLTSTIGYLNLLHDTKDLEADKREAYTEIALNKATRLETLVEQFFEISQLNLRETVLDKTWFSLNLLMEQITDEFYPLLEGAEKEVTVSIAEDIQVYGDAGLLARVFSNILQNAIVYSDPHSTISVCASKKAALETAFAVPSVEVTITNRGETIPPEQLQQVFDKFYRLDESRTSITGGSGLGLAIAREIVTQHGGTITAKSNYGKTDFIVVLPL